MRKKGFVCPRHTAAILKQALEPVRVSEAPSTKTTTEAHGPHSNVPEPNTRSEEHQRTSHEFPTKGRSTQNYPPPCFRFWIPNSQLTGTQKLLASRSLSTCQQGEEATPKTTRFRCEVTSRLVSLHYFTATIGHPCLIAVVLMPPMLLHSNHGHHHCRSFTAM